MNLIVGLGNPGSAYKNTRHNIGFMVIDHIIEKLKPSIIKKNSFKAELYKTDNNLLLKPLTFMNLSGQSIFAVKNFYKINNIIVIHDDLDLKFGAVKFKKAGGNGGHNGLKSIDSLIGNDYVRIRMGIGRPNKDVSSYVLNNFSKEENTHIQTWIEYVSKIVFKIYSLDLELIKSKYSQKEIKCN